MDEKTSTVTLPLLVTKGLILFPGNNRLIDAGRDFSINAIKVSKEKASSLILISSQIEDNIEVPKPEDIYKVGVLARIISISEREKRVKARVEVISRVQISNISTDDDTDHCYAADGVVMEDIKPNPQESDAIVSSINHELEKYPIIASRIPKNILAMANDPSASIELCYALAGHFDAPVAVRS